MMCCGPARDEFIRELCQMELVSVCLHNEVSICCAIQSLRLASRGIEKERALLRVFDL